MSRQDEMASEGMIERLWTTLRDLFSYASRISQRHPGERAAAAKLSFELSIPGTLPSADRHDEALLCCFAIHLNAGLVFP
jgi:hypothetical protein